jgi:hypothetical protein
LIVGASIGIEVLGVAYLSGSLWQAFLFLAPGLAIQVYAFASRALRESHYAEDRLLRHVARARRAIHRIHGTQDKTEGHDHA